MGIPILSLWNEETGTFEQIMAIRGADGRGIKSIGYSAESGVWTVTYTDGTSETITGPQAGDGSAGPAGEDGGYYTPNVASDGTLTWAPSKSGMPAAGSSNILGPQGPAGEGGGYYTPKVASDGTLTWAPSKSSMPAAGSSNILGPQGPAGEGGGYYTPKVASDGTLTWAPSKSSMPAVGSSNILGPQGPAGENAENLPEVFWITAAFADGTYTTDKTFAEIVEAYNAGKVCLINNSGGRVYYLAQVKSESLYFTSTDEGYTYRFTISSENKVTLSTQYPYTSANQVTAGTFPGVVSAGSQAAGTSLLRNSRIMSATEAESVTPAEGEIIWVYEE